LRNHLRETRPQLNALAGYAVQYFHDFVLPHKKFREPTPEERSALLDLRDALALLKPDATSETIQNVVYEIGRREPFLDKTGRVNSKDGRPGVSLDWFNMLYPVLPGQEKGPRFGSFVAVYGIDNTVGMIDGALARSAGFYSMVSLPVFLPRCRSRNDELQLKRSQPPFVYG
jgi:lysyl-tRNA synthetase class 1